MRKKILLGLLSIIIISMLLLVLLVPYLTQKPTLHMYPKHPMSEVFSRLDTNTSYCAFDENGVIMPNYYDIGKQYNPVTVSQYAIHLYQKFYDSCDLYFREAFFVQVDWLVANARSRGNYTVWEYLFDWDYYGLKDPWVSAMAQGEAISVLIRAYNLTGDQAYLELMHSAIGAFEVDASEGGVSYTDSNGYVWFSYGTDGKVVSHVLNGFIFALLGLYEASDFSERAEFLFDTGTTTLIFNLHRFDADGTWSYYDLLKCIAQVRYHKLHIQQLETMYNITGEQTFLQYSLRFQVYMDTDLKPKGRSDLA